MEEQNPGAKPWSKQHDACGHEYVQVCIRTRDDTVHHVQCLEHGQQSTYVGKHDLRVLLKYVFDKQRITRLYLSDQDLLIKPVPCTNVYY